MMTNTPERGSAAIWTVALLVAVLYAGLLISDGPTFASLPPLVACVIVAAIAVDTIRTRGRNL